MTDIEKFNQLIEGFSEWRSRYGSSWEIFDPIIAALEVRDKSENLAAVYGLPDKKIPRRLAGERWKIASYIRDGDPLELETTLSEIRAVAGGTMSLILCRLGVVQDRRQIFEFVSEAFRMLENGGVLLVEQISTPDHKDTFTTEGFLFFEYALKFLGLAIAEVYAFPVERGVSERRVNFLCQRPLNDEGRLTERFEEAVRLVQFPAYCRRFDTSTVSDFESSGAHIEEAKAIADRMSSDILMSEAAVAALSETALGAADMGRRLLKAERRIMEIRKQTSIFYPITYPWARFASVALAQIKKVKENKRKRRQRPLKPDLDSDDDGPAAIRPIVIQPKTVILNDNPRILILKLDHIGDFLLSIPAIELLRQAWPGARITLVCSPTNEGLARSSGIFDEVRTFKFSTDMSEDVKKIDRKIYANITSIVPDVFDIAIDLRHDPDSRPHLGFVNASLKAGFEAHGKYYSPMDITLPLFSTQNGLYHNSHVTHRLMLLASHVINCFKPLKFEQAGNGLVNVESDLDFAKMGPFVAFAPGGGTRAKKWSPEKFAELAARIIKRHGLKVVLLGGPAEEEYGAAIRSSIPTGQFVDLIAKLPLVNVPKVLDQARAVIGTDTGVTHLAALLGKPTVVLFSGVADVSTWRPIGNHVTIVRVATACSPCQIAKLDQCVAEHVCMSEIDVEVAFNALSSHLVEGD